MKILTGFFLTLAERAFHVVANAHLLRVNLSEVPIALLENVALGYTRRSFCLIPKRRSEPFHRLEPFRPSLGSASCTANSVQVLKSFVLRRADGAFHFIASAHVLCINFSEVLTVLLESVAQVIHDLAEWQNCAKLGRRN